MRCGVAAATVTRIRDNFESLAARFFSLITPPEEGASAATPESVPESELISEIADAPDLLKRCMRRSWRLERRPKQSCIATHAATAARCMEAAGGQGRRMYRDVELVTGNRYGDRFDDRARIAERDRYANRKFSATETRAIH